MRSDRLKFSSPGLLSGVNRSGHRVPLRSILSPARRSGASRSTGVVETTRSLKLRMVAASLLSFLVADGLLRDQE